MRPVRQKVTVGEGGSVPLSEEQRRRWGIAPGAELVLRETPEGIILRRADPVLSRLIVEPTSHCNLDCRTCVRHSWDEPGGTMDIELYRRLLADLSEVPSLHTVSFWGFGEPLMHRYIVEMISLAKRLGLQTEMISNALLLDDRMAEQLVKAGLDRIVVSVDGASPEAYGDVRSGADLSIVKVNVERLHRIKLAAEAKNPEVGLEFVVMKSNVDQLGELRNLARTMQASFVVVSNLLPYTEDMKDEILYWLWAGCAYPPERSHWNPEVILPNMDARREAVGPLLKLLEHGGLAGAALHRPDGAPGYCRFVNEGVACISWDGEVSPCVALMHSYTCYVRGRAKRIRRHSFGNIGREPLASIWEHADYVQLRDLVQRFDFPPCTDCGGCQLAESNEEDCFGNTFPVCGDCLWAKGVVQCP